MKTLQETFQGLVDAYVADQASGTFRAFLMATSDEELEQLPRELKVALAEWSAAEDRLSKTMLSIAEPA